MSDCRPWSPWTALYCEQPGELDVAQEETAEWTDHASGTDAEPSWYKAHADEMELYSDTTDLASYVDNLTSNDELYHSLFDAGDSKEPAAGPSYVAGPVEPSAWLHEQLPVSSGNDNLHTWSPEQQLQQQTRESQTDKRSSEATATTQTFLRPSLAALTHEEEWMLSGGAPYSLTYRGRRLRHIAPKPPEPPSSVQAVPPTQSSSIQQRETLPPKMTFSVLLNPPPAATATTPTIISPAANHDERPPPPGKTPPNYFTLHLDCRETRARDWLSAYPSL